MNKKMALLCFFCFIILCAFKIDTLKNMHNSTEISAEKLNIYIFIDLTKRKLYIIDPEEKMILKQYPIASGKSNTPSPVGTWRVVSKGKWSGGFGTRWIGLNVPWGRYGIHGTNKPHSIGQAASHGCIRMFNKDIEGLYQYVDYGTIVVIYAGPDGPFYKGFRILKPGDRGADVYYVQAKLRQLNYYAGNPDGIYGEKTKRSVIKYRIDKGLPLTHDIDKDFLTSLGITFYKN